jgi:tetratricopeptide (TPR) repeat protein
MADRSVPPPPPQLDRAIHANLEGSAGRSAAGQFAGRAADHAGGSRGRLDPKLAELIERRIVAVRKRPRSAEARRALGHAYHANDLLVLAIECYMQAMELGGHCAETWYLIALAHEGLGDTGGAAVAAERAVRLDAGLTTAQWRLGHWLIDLGRTDEAIEHLERVVKLNPHESAAWYALAEAHLQRRPPQAQRAIDIVTSQGVLAGPNRLAAHQLLAAAYRQLGRIDEAAQALARAGSARPVWNDPIFDSIRQLRTGHAAAQSAAEQHLQQGRYDQALPILHELRRSFPDDRRTLNMIGAAHLAMGRYDQAIEAFGESVTRNPDHYHSRLNYAAAIVQASRYSPRDMNVALRHVDAAAALRPEAATAHELRGTILQQLTRHAEAVESFKKAFELDARRSDALMQAGLLEFQLGRIGDASNAFATLLRHDPDNVSATLALASTLIELGRVEEATAVIDRAARLEPPGSERIAALRQLLQRFEVRDVPR